ncbi:MAG: hypothetical protein QXF30_05455 [Thermoplasmata archaeon]
MKPAKEKADNYLNKEKKIKIFIHLINIEPINIGISAVKCLINIACRTPFTVPKALIAMLYLSKFNIVSKRIPKTIAPK